MKERNPGLFRLYGEPPYRVIVLHGGPGAPGCAAGLCRGISEFAGVVEHLQRANYVDGLLEEIRRLIDDQCGGRAAVIGHSFGAWLALLFADRYPGRTEKAVLIGCGPLDRAYLPILTENRRLRREQGMEDTDNFCPLPGSGGDMLYFDEAQHISLMREMNAMRERGELLRTARRIVCPVAAIHGLFDPHPVQGIAEPMKGMENFSLTALEKCGHDPWKERYAREAFFERLRSV